MAKTSGHWCGITAINKYANTHTHTHPFFLVVLSTYHAIAWLILHHVQNIKYTMLIRVDHKCKNISSAAHSNVWIWNCSPSHFSADNRRFTLMKNTIYILCHRKICILLLYFNKMFKRSAGGCVLVVAQIHCGWWCLIWILIGVHFTVAEQPANNRLSTVSLISQIFLTYFSVSVEPQ